MASSTDIFLAILGITFLITSIAYANKDWLLHLWLDRQVSKQKQFEQSRVEEWYEDTSRGDFVYTHPECPHDMKWRIVKVNDYVESCKDMVSNGPSTSEPFPIISIKTQDDVDILSDIRSYCGPNNDWHKSIMGEEYFGQLSQMQFRDVAPGAYKVTVFQMNAEPFERTFNGEDNVIESLESLSK